MSDETQVLYNAACPVCRAEIDHYAAYSVRNALPIQFEDLNAVQLDAWGLTEEDAARRLHVMKNGAPYSGIPAFLVLWQDMPRYRLLARVVALPIINWFAVQTYDYVLAPLLYRWHMHRQKRRAQTSSMD